MKVKKYNKTTEDFDKSKIIKSIKLAAEATKTQTVPEFMINRIADSIENQFNEQHLKSVTAKEISDLVENKLMKTAYKDVAKSYITYHYEREKEHVYNSDLIKAFKKKLNATSVENSNANLDERSFSGRMNEAARVLYKDDALRTMSKIYKDNHNNNEIYTHDLDSYSSGQHNCFESSTEFITSNGIRQFKQFIDGEPVVVLAGDGEWREAIVRNYSKQRSVQTVELEYHDTKKGLDTVNIKCTKDHRWYLIDGTVTTDLKVGDKLAQLPKIKNFNNIEIKTKEDAEMWCLGFILGDGCDNYEYTNILLCNDKIKYVDMFEKAYYQKANINAGENRIGYFKRLPVNKQTFLTNKMWKMLDMHQKQLLFDGYIHADGNYSHNEYPSSCFTADERILEFVKDLSCLCGYHIRRITEIIHDTNFKKDARLWEIDFIVNQNHTGYWIVKSITPGTHNNSSVWCVEEPVTHSFILSGGILTGNCLSIPFDNMFEQGVNIKQTDIRQPKSIATAFQLIAVYMQVQSLQQFGGVAATHLDWSLVPSLRYSFYKHFKDGLRYLLTEEDYDEIMGENYPIAALTDSTTNTETTINESTNSKETL